MKDFKHTQFHIVSVRTFVIPFYCGSGSATEKTYYAKMTLHWFPSSFIISLLFSVPLQLWCKGPRAPGSPPPLWAWCCRCGARAATPRTRRKCRASFSSRPPTPRWMNWRASSLPSNPSCRRTSASKLSALVRFPLAGLCAVLRIHDILGWIRIRIWIRGSMPLTNGSGSCYFRH
jgi:hypothetical protein